MNTEKTKIVAIGFAEWIKYNEEVFEKWLNNKISTEKLYMMYIDEVKP